MQAHLLQSLFLLLTHLLQLLLLLLQILQLLQHQATGQNMLIIHLHCVLRCIRIDLAAAADIARHI